MQSSKKMPTTVESRLSEGSTPPPIRTIMGTLTPLLQLLLAELSQQLTQAALMFCMRAPVTVYPFTRQQLTTSLPCLKVNRKSRRFPSAQMGEWQPEGRVTCRIAITALPLSAVPQPVNMLHSVLQSEAHPVAEGLVQVDPHWKLYMPQKSAVAAVLTSEWVLQVRLSLLYFSHTTMLLQKQGENSMLHTALLLSQPTKSNPRPAPAVSNPITLLLNIRLIVQSVADPPPFTSPLAVFSRNSSCWEVPRSGTTPTDELVPSKNPLMALAVEDSERSSSNDTTCALPMAREPVLWQPLVSSSSLLVWTVVLCPERAVQSWVPAIMVVPSDWQTKGVMETAPKVERVEAVDEEKQALPEMKQRKLVLMKAPTLAHTTFLVPVLQVQQTVVPVQAGRLWAMEPSRMPAASRVISTVQRPVMGEAWAKLKPMLKELQTRMLGLEFSALKRERAVVRVPSVQVLSMPQNSWMRGDMVLMAMLLTWRASASRPFSITFPDTNSVQYPLMPRMEWQSGLLMDVVMRMAVPAVTEFIEKVMQSRSSDMVQKLSTAAALAPMAEDWHSPMNVKSVSVVPVACEPVPESQQISSVKLPPVLLDWAGVMSMSQEQMEEGLFFSAEEEAPAMARVPVAPRGARMSRQPKAMLESQMMRWLSQALTAMTCSKQLAGVVVGLRLGQTCTSYQVLGCIAQLKVTWQAVEETVFSFSKVAVATSRLLEKTMSLAVTSVLRVVWICSGQVRRRKSEAPMPFSRDMQREQWEGCPSQLQVTRGTSLQMCPWVRLSSSAAASRTSQPRIADQIYVLQQIITPSPRTAPPSPPPHSAPSQSQV